MALERKDNIGDTSTTTGTGTLNLAAVAQTGALIFAGNVTSGATVRYDIRSSDNTEWEIGEGVFTDGSPDTLTRVTVYKSSNAGSLVNFSAGTKNVSMVFTVADMATLADGIAPQNLLKNGNFINNSTNGYGSTPDDWTSSNANPVQGGIPALTKQNLIDGLGIEDGDIEGLWSLDGNLNDLSSNGYNLTASASAPTDSSSGLMAQAKLFTEASDQYATNPAANCRLAGNQTFFAFIKPSTFPTVSTRIAGVCDSSATSYAGLQFDNGTYFPTFIMKGVTVNATDRLYSPVKCEAGKWYMIVGVLDSSNTIIKIWVNGVKTQGTYTGSHSAGTGGFSVGRLGDLVETTGYFDGLIQNVGILSVALTDTQVRKLLAMTIYKGQKIRRETTNAYMYQKLPQDLVERLRGKTVALRADLWQEVASTAQISIHQTMAGATTSETIISATDATTGSWLSKVATGTLEANVVTVEIRLRHSTSNGNTWFKNVSLYEGSTLLPYDHSKEDWSRFPRLLKMDIPAVISGYQFEENRWFDWTPTVTVSGGTVPTYTGQYSNRFRIIGQAIKASMSWFNGSGGTAGAGAGALKFSLPAPLKSSLFSGDRSTLGFGWSQESAGTQTATAITIGANVSEGEHLLVSSGAQITGDDQSSTSRTINGLLEYEID